MTTIVFADRRLEPYGGAERGGVGERRVAGEELVRTPATWSSSHARGFASIGTVAVGRGHASASS